MAGAEAALAETVKALQAHTGMLEIYCENIAKGLQDLAQAQREVAKKLKAIKVSCEGIHEKQANIELRQCMTVGQGTDAARMLGQYLKAGSASWSSQHQALILEMLYGDTSGTLRAIEYKGLFAKKDKRRAEYLVAIVWVTIILKDPKHYDCQDDTEAHDTERQFNIS